MTKLRSALIAGFVCLGLLGSACAAASAATISGTVTAEGGGPIEGIEVCAWPRPEAFDSICDETDAGGQYTLANLPVYDYLIRFSAQRNNLRYVDEFYDDEDLSGADTVHPESNMTIDAALAEGGSIGGTVSDETAGLPIAGLWACARDDEGDWTRCAASNAAGEYVLNGLPTGTYTVEYEGSYNRVNYLREFYEDAADWATATDLAVTAPGSVTGIDAELAPGAEILGRVTDVVTGGPLYDVTVCAAEPGPVYRGRCTWTDTGGNYALRGLPAGTYLMEFGINFTPIGRFAGQYWQGASTVEEADPITIAPPESLSGIDGAVEDWYGSPLPGSGSQGGGEAPGDPLPNTSQPPPAATPKARRCKKGFHRKLVKGKKRCVRKHRRHRHGHANR